MDIHKFYQFFFRFFRKKRMQRFSKTFHLDEQTKILDVGGDLFNWSFVDCLSEITLLNIYLPDNQENAPKNVHFVLGDGTSLTYSDREFDICFSNSVIEHLGNYESQVEFSKEVSRVGKKIWIQTPAKTFFIEPHYMTPFIHYLSKKIQRKLLRNFTLWGWIARPSQDIVDRFVSELRLLTYTEMAMLFPDCEIRREKFLCFTKAFIAVRQ